MKVCLIQPGYSLDYSESDRYFKEELAYLDACDPSMDIIVLPESCDVPCLAKTKAESEESVKKYNASLLSAASKTAKRCHALLFINARYPVGDAFRNTTYAFNREGVLSGTYFKQHLVPSEVSVMHLDHDYMMEFSSPTVMEIDGLRFGFLTCYDFYFYEAFSNLARQNLDFIIGCSHQRSDTHTALRLMSQFLAYNTNAYVLRASVSMGAASETGGSSLVASPRGELLLDMENRTGLATIDIDPAEKYFKPAGFGNPPAAHYQYVESGRHPWKYRPAGSAIVPSDADMPYPRLCASGGVFADAPKESMPALGAAVALSAKEIRFNLWPSKDGALICLPQPALNEVSDAQGMVYEKTLSELMACHFGVSCKDAFAGLPLLQLEDILKKFACHTVMNICLHVPDRSMEEALLEKTAALLTTYDCRRYTYFSDSSEAFLGRIRAKMPDVGLCMTPGEEPWSVVRRAIDAGCQKVLFSRLCFDRSMLDAAHAKALRCLISSDDPIEAKSFFDIGFDTLLTENYLALSPLLKK